MDIGDYHPNVRGSKIQNKKAALRYCSKEDPTPLQFNIDIKAEQAAREGHRKIVATKLLSGEVTLVDAVKDDPSMLFGYKKLKMDLEQYLVDSGRASKNVAKWVETPWNYSLRLKTSKCRHFWIWSEGPNKGKTTAFLEPIDQKYRASWYNYSEQFQMIHADS